MQTAAPRRTNPEAASAATSVIRADTAFPKRSGRQARPHSRVGRTSSSPPRGRPSAWARSQGRSTARRGPARKPASTSSGIASRLDHGHGRRTARPRGASPALARAPSRRARRAPAAATPRPARAAARASGRRARRRAPPRRRAGRRARRRRARRARRRASATAATPPYGWAGSAAASTSGSVVARRVTQLAQPLDRAGQRELRAAEPLDEVAAAAGADRLERAQLAVDGAVAAGDPLGADAVARHDPLPLEQQLRERASVGRASRRPKSRPASDQRPGGRTSAPRRGHARSAAAGARRPRHAVAALGAQRRPGVVRHLARPDELPERRQRVAGVEPRRGRADRARTRRSGRARRGSRRAPRPRRAAHRARARRGRRVVAEEERDAVEPGPDPDDLAGRAERVERGRLVAGHAARQDLGLPERDRQRAAPGAARAPRAACARAVDAVPAGQEAAERRLLGGLDLAAQARERRAPEPPQHVRVAPLALDAARPQLAADEPVARARAPPSASSTRVGLEAVPPGHLAPS